MNNNLSNEEKQKFNGIVESLGLKHTIPSDHKQHFEEEELKCEKCGCDIHPCMPCEEVVVLNGNHTDDSYFELLNLILEEGRVKRNRTGIDTIGVFGAQAKFDVSMDAFPILTTKKVHFPAIVHELLWFIKGDTNIKYLVDNNVRIWNEWAYKKYREAQAWNLDEAHFSPPDIVSLFTQDEFVQKIKDDVKFAKKWGDLGEGTYGGMWRAFPTNVIDNITPPMDTESNPLPMEFVKVDQLKKVVDKLKTNPDDRRMIVSAWHPYWVDHCALPPCHCLFHFNTEELDFEERKELGVIKESANYKGMSDLEVENFLNMLNIPKRRLNCLLYQRSCDTFLGVPFNITSYCLLLAMIAHCVNMEPGVFTHTYGDLHIYTNHMTQIKEQMDRTPRMLPKLWLNPQKRDLFEFTFDDIKLEGYNPHPPIKGQVAV